ncbi:MULTISPECIES: STAS domain-containing protein [Vibrio]|uniref:Anti-sigma factor antagonist n=1 Tax=Vibrio mediterranei TaxID=689 RepID=A0A2S9ZTV8_9VIBR|nr:MULTISPECIES: STAS domain-containing protein [Vibrio]AYV22662.1 anti-sigma factor antagonist [Vibrio mediterranei]EDL53203.1 anti-anti-sigma factor [Vibrio mediterranei AK1]MCF4173073.1 STAS domain-containing protein [Vibrio sp. McD22-P3]MCY9853303.1 STAS domain-containing protein [Vibrio mediterranei]MDA0108019.1 STAS domain-containing protein [Vibrio sp. La 4.2.2]
MSFIAYSNETHTVIEVDAPHFDAKTVPSFRQCIDGLDDSLNRCMLLDLTSVTFMDSSALGALMALRKTHQCDTICLITESVPVLQLLKVTKVDQLVTVYPDLEQAITAN